MCRMRGMNSRRDQAQLQADYAATWFTLAQAEQERAAVACHHDLAGVRRIR